MNILNHAAFFSAPSIGRRPRACRGRVPSRLGGAALIVAMIFLVILTTLGLSGLRTASLEEHFVGNLRDNNMAFNAAESALRYAEDWLAIRTRANRPRPETSSCGATPCDVMAAFALEDGYLAEKSPAWWASNGRAYVPDSGTSNLVGVSNQPRFIIEELGEPLDGSILRPSTGALQVFYRITAFGQGGSQYTNVVLQSTFGKIY